MRLGLARSRKVSGFTLTLFMFCFVGVIFAFTLFKLRPAFIEYASAYANNIANDVVNDAVSEVFSQNGYSALTDTKTSYSGGIKALETDTVKVNRLKSEITRLIQDKIKTCQSETVSIPLGSAANIYFLAGLGPKIPIRIYPVSVVNTDFNDEFTSAGINQVYHKIYLDVSIEMSFIGFAFAENETVKTSALLSETIIVGDTPQYYGSTGLAVPAQPAE